ncbi:MAG TPA: hypothetical protein VNT26_00115, partial [Candidatus Sulfotelmatobacter sp.]|nr:hypothetical protein [Candidatus Sulfotelmatobacter sp.]
PYGYLAKNGAIESSIERLGGVITEQSRGRQGVYVNGRGFNPRAPLAIQPKAEGIEYTGGRNFRLLVNWQADSPAPKDLSVFYHFNRPTPGRYTDTEFHGGGQPTPPTSHWSGHITTGRDWAVSIPEGMPLGEYEVLVGLYDAAGRAGRYRLLGDEDSARRYRIGTLVVEGTVANGKTNVTGVRLDKPQAKPVIATQLLANRTPVRFDVATTTGAFRVQRQGQSLLLVPLPDGEDFEVSLSLEHLFDRSTRVRSLQAVDAKGTNLHPVPFKTATKSVQFTARKEDFGYRLEVE